MSNVAFPFDKQVCPLWFESCKYMCWHFSIIFHAVVKKTETVGQRIGKSCLGALYQLLFPYILLTMFENMFLKFRP